MARKLIAIYLACPKIAAYCALFPPAMLAALPLSQQSKGSQAAIYAAQTITQNTVTNAVLCRVWKVLRTVSGMADLLLSRLSPLALLADA